MLPREVKPWLESDNFFSFHISSLFSSGQEAENVVTLDNIAEEILGGAIMQAVKETKSASLSSMETSDIQLSPTISSERGAKDFQPCEPTTASTTTLLTNASTSQENNQSFQILTTGDDDVDDDDEDEMDDDDDISVEHQKEMTTNKMTNIKKRKLKNDENALQKKAKPVNIEEPSDREESISEDFVPSISQEEMEETSASVDDCSTIGQLLSLIRELKESKKGTKLRGFKICLNKLKSMRDEVKQLADSANNDDNSTSKKTKKLLLKKSKTSVKKLLAKNLPLCDD